ncbi:MAG: aminotransferase class I/II-fold pyridoxal phosphate-dependent enzyme, partial [Burkholderiaceae bacterium]
MSKFWSSLVRELSPYTPGEQANIPGLIKLNTNENPYPPSSKALAAIQAAADERLRLYPDPESGALRQAIGEACGVPTDHVFVGNGSDEVLAFVFQGLLDGKGKGPGEAPPLVFPEITYSFYPTYCRLYGIRYECLRLEDDFSLDLQKIPAKAHAVIFPNPNAPTGRALARRNIEAFAAARPDRLVVVDEVQWAPGLFAALRPEIDEDRRAGRFLLLGSASAGLLRQSAESLAGRIAYKELTPLLASELAADITT